MSLPLNWPGSLDSFANPTPTQETDDPGFELDLVISRIHTLLMALEVKLGTGSGAPAVGQVLRGTGSGAAQFGALQTADMAANAVSQSGFSTGFANQTFTGNGSYVTLQGDGPSSELRVDLTTVGGPVFALLLASCTNGTANAIANLSVSMDGAAEPFALPVQNPTASAYFYGMHLWRFVPSAATHQFRGRISSSTGTPAAQNKMLLVWELKR